MVHKGPVGILNIIWYGSISFLLSRYADTHVVIVLCGEDHLGSSQEHFLPRDQLASTSSLCHIQCVVMVSVRRKSFVPPVQLTAENVL